MSTETSIEPVSGDALLIVDVQNDFLPGGSLAIAEGDQIIPVLNRYIKIFQGAQLPIYATRDWHPANHCSFNDQGGIWPKHCVANTWGSAFATTLRLPDTTVIISKATTADKDAYSGFEGTDLVEQLRAANIKRLFVGGLATDYCVLNTVKDALKKNFQILLLQDAIRAVDINSGDGERATAEMHKLGAISEKLLTEKPP